MAIQSKKDNSRSTLASASKFGVALSGLFVAQEIQAEVLPLTFDAFFATQFVEGQETVVLDYQVFMYSVPLADLSLYPDFGLDNSGQIFANNHLLNYQTKDGYDSVFVEERSLRFGSNGGGFAFVQPGAELAPSNFFPQNDRIDLERLGSGEYYVGLRDTSPTLVIAWFKLEVTQFGGPITFIGGYVANEGETLVVGDTRSILGDINCDGVVDLLDVQPFVQLLQGGEFSDKADFDMDGAVTLLDVPLFVNALTPPLPVVEMKGDELHIDGSTENDFIEVRKAGTSHVRVLINEEDFGTYQLPQSGTIIINGLEGDDEVIYQTSVPYASIVFGGAGNDTIRTGSGGDEVYGDDGDDTIFSRSGDDIVVGGIGNDTIFGQDGEDVLSGGVGDDSINGGSGDDVLAGESGQDSLNGGAGFDTALDFGELEHLNIEKNKGS